MTEEARGARRDLYASADFRDELAERLNFGIERVTAPIDALLRAEIIPCPRVSNAEALAFDGAKILLAIGGQQTRPASIVRVSERLGAMTMQAEIGNKESAGAADIFPKSKSASFEADLAAVIQTCGRLRTGRRRTASGPPRPACCGATSAEACSSASSSSGKRAGRAGPGSMPRRS